MEDYFPQVIVAIPLIIASIMPLLLLKQSSKAARELAILSANVEQVHKLVNAEKTASIERELAGAKRELGMVKRFAPKEIDQISTLESYISRLEDDLIERLRQTELAEKEVAKA